MDVASIAIVVAALGVTLDWEPVHEAAPQKHAVRFQSDDGWSGGRYPSADNSSRQFDQRGATIGVQPIRTAEASPWTLDGAQQTATDVGKSLRDTMSSGVQQTTQQVSESGQQLLDSARNAGRDFGQQLQNITGLGDQPPPRSASSTSRSTQSWPAPPPLAESVKSPRLPTPRNPATTPTTWSSIRPELAPPRLATPPMTNSVRVANNPSAGRPSAGPSFPPPPTTSAPPLHSVLSDSATTSSRTADPNWLSAGETGSASHSASSDDDGDMGLVPVPPPPRTASKETQPPPATEQSADPWEWSTTSTPATITAKSAPAPGSSPVGDRYSQPATTAPAAKEANKATEVADKWANFGLPPTSEPNRAQPQPQAPIATNPPNQSAPQQSPTGPPMIATQSAAAQSTQQAPLAEEVPWKPLLAVSLALAGSLGANLFLGWSYADARRRYRALVAKTTYSFQKAAGVAA